MHFFQKSLLLGKLFAVKKNRFKITEAMKAIKFSLFIAFCCVFFSHLTFAQVDRMKDVFEDVITEMEQDIFTIRFFDAITGKPVEGANVLIENIGAFETDSAGRVMFPRHPDGMLRVIFKKPKYIQTMFDVEIVAETIFINRFSVSPELNIDQFRVVLDWDEKPKDLDAHFVKDGNYHISYRNTRVLSDGTGMLDRDDMDGYGPETITVARIDFNGNYSFFVHNYSQEINAGAPNISVSKATVRVYGNNKLLKTYTIPQNFDGKTWNVFRVVNGQVTDY